MYVILEPIEEVNIFVIIIIRGTQITAKRWRFNKQSEGIKIELVCNFVSKFECVNKTSKPIKADRNLELF